MSKQGGRESIIQRNPQETKLPDYAKSKFLTFSTRLTSDLLSILKNGSLTGNLSEPHSTTCSRTWETPEESPGTVRRLQEKALMRSWGAERWRYLRRRAGIGKMGKCRHVTIF